MLCGARDGLPRLVKAIMQHSVSSALTNLKHLILIRRDLLMSVCESFLDEDELRMIRLLLANTSLSTRVSRTLSKSFDTTIGTPYGDSLSPILFSIIWKVPSARLDHRPLS